MRVVHTERHRLHRPSQFIKRGRPAPTPEVPERGDAILASLRAAGHPVEEPPDLGLGPVRAVHSAGLIDFLATGYARWRELPDAGEEMIPNVHPGPRFRTRPQSVVGQLGYHTSDSACPIGPGTWEAVLAVAHATAHAADIVMQGARASYALCRPPGHHAAYDTAGGFCYLNNAAVAAQRLRGRFARVAVLDVDVHHGNGTQDIFWERPDVFFASIHGDPDGYYPFFSGYRHETGAGAGEGFTLNVPFPVGSGDAAVRAAADEAIAGVRRFAPEALVVSLGVDASEHDPHGGHAVTAAGFAAMAARVAALDLPTVLVQEGGYLCDALGPNVAGFLAAFG